jgi:hypothetical protein
LSAEGPAIPVSGNRNCLPVGNFHSPNRDSLDADGDDLLVPNADTSLLSKAMDFLREALKKDPEQTWSDEITAWKKAHAELRERETGQNLRIVELDYEKSKLEIKVAALVRLLVEAGVVDPGKLDALMTEIDFEDGVADGRVTPPGGGRSLFVAESD